MPYKNPADDITKSRAYYAAHREEQQRKQRARYQRNKAAYKAARAAKPKSPEAMERKRAQDRAAYAKNPLKMRRDQLRIRYGLSWEAYTDLIASQGGRCAVCAKVPQGTKKKHITLHVDHDHATGTIRGLLCDKCNRGIGLLGDDAATLLRGARYIEQHAANARHTA